MLDDYKSLWNEIEQIGLPQEILRKIFEKLEQDQVAHYVSANVLKETSHFKLSSQPSDLETIKYELLNYMDKAINTQSPYFINQLYGGTHPVAVLGEWVNAFMNTSMATYEIAPLATLFEKEIIESLAHIMKWNSIDGLMVPGGSYANMMALHLARFIKNPSVKTEGLQNKNIVYISDQAHYSVKKSAHLLGFGENQVRVVPSDSNFKMKIDELESCIQEDLAKGCIPALIVSTLGTTVFGALDPIAEAQNLAVKYRLWHHVDGAWGGPLVFADKKVQEALKDVDSVAFDFHKLLGGTLTKAIFVTRHENLLSQANSCAGTQYIFHEDEDSFFDTGTKAIQCGRKVDSLSLWMTWKYLGHSGFKSYVNKQLQLRNHVLKLIKKYNYTLIHEPEYLNICFKVKAFTTESPIGFIGTKDVRFDVFKDLETDEFQKLLRRELIKGGQVFVNYSSTEKHGVFIRLVLNHLRLTETTLDHIFEIIHSTAERLSSKKTHEIPSELAL